MSLPEPFESALSDVISELVGPAAAYVDDSAVFPRKSIDALADAGLLALSVPSEFGGAGLGPTAAAELVRRLSTACGSTAMVVTMHYAATAVLAATGREDVLREIGARRHLSTLAFSEVGSRSHFWAPLSTARIDGREVVLDARKSWVTSAHEADSYVWSSRPVSGDGPMTLWLVPREAPGLRVSGGFDGVGLRGNDSCPITADGVRVDGAARLGDDGAGLDVALSAALPWFLLLNASVGVGLAQAVVAETTAHLVATRLEHVDQSLAQQLPSRVKLASMQIQTDRIRALIEDALNAVESGRADAQLLVLEVKAAADEAAASVTDLAMIVGGGAAFRKETGIERRFRDARATRVMAPTSDALLDFVGRALTGLPLLDA